ncbi:MAG: ROK family protein [Actinobacteria bacterium]|nr:ROK family protein [Actinomycetota bacterium]
MATALVEPDRVVVQRVATSTEAEPWSASRLAEIVADACAGTSPEIVVVAVPGQVDEFHGAVQYSPTLPWHDVAVGSEVAAATGCEVLVRHAARVGALAESNLGAGVGEGTMLYVSAGASIVAAGAQSGVVVADHVGAGDIGATRIRSGPGQGGVLDAFASGEAIARRYEEATGRRIEAAEVHGAIGSDAVARRIWDDAVDALADALEWATLLFAPQIVVVGGGLSDAGDDLIVPLAAGVARRLAPRAVPAVRRAAFGADAGWVGAAFAGWRKLGRPVEAFDALLDAHFGADRCR